MSPSRKKQTLWKIHFAAVIAAFFVLYVSAAYPDINRALKESSSPYLSSHAGDLVKWRTLTNETLTDSRQSARPIFLTSGYHACYWCYRLKKDTFSNPELAELLNSKFTPVIIDREVHTAEDTFLQNSMRDTLGITGWPLMVILTPDAAPIYGYSYTRPRALMDSLETFLPTWETASGTIIADAQRQIKQLNESVSNNNQTGNITTAQLLKSLLSQANTAADQDYGGFGLDEKYPWVPQMLALIDLMEINPQPTIIEFIAKTAHAIRQGAITDQLSGGVFRYATSRDWGTPHYEQMLYTQALVTKLFARTARLTGDKALGIAALRSAYAMTSNFKLENDWYRASRSAVSAEGEDGGYYLWSKEELRDVLGDNWDEMVADLGSGTSQILPGFPGENSAEAAKLLKAARDRRTQVTDNKVILGWNGLVLSGLASVAGLDKALYPAANILAENLLKIGSRSHLGILVSSSEKSADTSLETYVYVAGGLLDWWQLTNDDRYAEVGTALLIRAHSLFYRAGLWEASVQPLIGPSLGRIHIPDSQLPSPSGEWMRLTQLAAYSNSAESSELGKIAAAVATSPGSIAEADEAFFHATTIATKVVRTLIQETVTSTSTHQ